MVSVTHAVPQADADEVPLDLLAEGLPAAGRERIEAALALARQVYGDDRLGTGEPFRRHALGMALIVAALKLDEETRLAALLFGASDRLDDCFEKLESGFGETVARLVDGLWRLNGLQLVTHAQARTPEHKGADVKAQSEVLRKMLLAMVEDIRVVLLRLASANCRRCASSPRTPGPRREEAARESLDIYAPLANRLGVWQLKWETRGSVVPLPRTRYLQAYRHAARREARRARAVHRRRHSHAARHSCAMAGIDGRHVWAPQAYLQHLEQDAQQGARLRARCTTCARCV